MTAEPMTRARSIVPTHRPWSPPRVRRVAGAIAASILLAAPAVGIRAAHAEPSLAEIAREVLRRAASGPAASVPEPTERIDAGDPIPAPLGAPDAPSVRNHTGGPGTSVSVPAKVSPPKTSATVSGAAAGYQSNSWRQVPAESARALTFSSGYVRPAPGLDPALRAHGALAKGESRAHVYGFLLPRVALDAALEKTLAALGVRVLGPHDDHVKVRVPVGALDAVAALPDVEWLGVSPPRQKQSLEVEEARAARNKGLAAADAIGLPIVINLFEPDPDGGARRRIEAAGAVVGDYDAGLAFYRAVATEPVIDRLAALDVVLFVELIRPTSGSHDQSMPLVDADLIRPGGGGTRFSGIGTLVGIMDSGFMMSSAAAVPHDDLIGKNGCGINYTSDAAGVWNDQHGHGTHVLGTLAGAGAAQARYRGMAPGVGSGARLRAAKIFTSTNAGNTAWTESAMDFMANAVECDTPAPLVINLSGGTNGTALTGTDSTSRKLDERVWTNRQVYVVAAGNSGPTASTVGTPAVAKNALAIGNVMDNGFGTVGDVAGDSSRGPTGDNRMKPNVSAPGNLVTSPSAGTTNGYRNMAGTSMATPHVTGLVATLMEHYPEMQNNPPLVRAHLMASAIAHDDVADKSNDYGIGRVAGNLAHWAQPDANGWSTHWSWGSVSDTSWHYRDITVPAGAQRLVVVMTFDEPAASAGASRAVTYDVDLWVDYLADCNNSSCGDWFSISSADNVEYIAINNPPAGLYRLKATNFRAPNFPLPVAIAATIIHGDPTPPMTMTLSVPSTVPYAGYDVTATVSTPSYVASGVQIEMTARSGGAILDQVSTTRHDGVTMSFFSGEDKITLGNVYPGAPRTATWRMSSFFTTPSNPVSFTVRAWSENGGTVTQTVSTVVVAPGPDLVETAATTNPAAPFLLPGGTFSVSDTVKNNGTKASTAATTRYYLSLDGGKDAGDIRLSATRAVPALAIGASHSGTVTLTVPTTAALNTYFLLACADDLATNAELDEANNCAVATTGAITVTRPDLIETGATTTPPSPIRAPGTTFSVTDTAGNAGRVTAGQSATRYYLSLNGAKDAGAVLLTGTRTVPSLASAATHLGTVTVTIPAATPPGNYFLLACADDLNAVVETSDANNCVAASSGLVAVTRPDLIMSTVSTNPATVVRAPGGTFSVTDSTLNAGQVASAASNTRYYLSLNGTKDAGDTLLTGTRAVPALAAGASHSGTVTVTIPATTPLNNYVLLACADDGGVVAETSEGNNCLAASGVATISVTRPDLVESSVTTTPAAPARAPGTTFQVTDTARNAGGLASTAASTRYYLSLDGVKGAGDILLTGTRAVPALAAGATHPGSATVTIPATTPLGTYTLFACADDLGSVVESNESNNCTAASTGPVTVARPDLVEDAVSPPPTTKARGTTFSVTDTTRNAGGLTSPATTVRYYLSLDSAKGAGDVLLTGTRPVAALAPGATSSSAVTVTIPAGTTLTSYFLLACADDTGAAVEVSETNNCRASATKVTITP